MKNKRFMRLFNPLAPDDENGKVATCARNVFRIWDEGKEERTTQLVFCDLSTPKGDGSFNVYEDLKQKLVECGIPEEEIAFIHDANTDARKKELLLLKRRRQPQRRQRLLPKPRQKPQKRRLLRRKRQLKQPSLLSRLRSKPLLPL